MSTPEHGGAPGHGAPRRHALSFADLAISILVAFNLAVAQPLLDLLGNNPEFFVAHHSTGFEVTATALLLTIAIPAALVVLVVAARRAHRKIGIATHASLIAALGSLLTAQVLDRAVGWSTPVIITAAAGAGLALAAAFYAWPSARSVVRVAAPVPLVVAGLFLFGSEVKAIVISADAQAVGASVQKAVPVVMIVFDEFPLVSLLDRDGMINARLFPNLARLAERSTWFRNTTTVATATKKAVPALLDGRFPRRPRIPTSAHHPHNLLALLPGRYDVVAVEPITDLCPGNCDPSAVTAGSGRWRALLGDLAVVSGHVLLPEDLTRRLPPIDQGWGGFVRNWGEAKHDDPRAGFESFLETLKRRRKPVLRFAHLLIPHRPWRFLPSGQEYPQTARLPGANGDEWSQDRWLVQQAYQRHLLQAGLADAFVGRLVAQLRDRGLWEEALVVVASDHGVAIRPGAQARSAFESTVGEIGAVPLFIKRPFQRSGAINDKPVQTIDVLPTIADVLGAKLSGDVDGISVFSDAFPERRKRLLASGGRRLRVAVDGRELDEALRRKFAMLGGAADDPFALAPKGFEDVLGRPVRGLTVSDEGGASGEVEDLEAYTRVDPTANVVPALVAGRLTTETAAPQVVAVALNGTIRAITRTYGSDGSFYAMLPPDDLRRGRNDIDLFLLEAGQQAAVRRVALEPA